MNTSLFGFLSGIFIFFYSIYLVIENSTTLLDKISLLIVVGGTASISIMTYGLGEITRILLSGFRTFVSTRFSSEKIIGQLVSISEKTGGKPELLAANVKDSKIHPFIKDGLQLIINKFSEEQIEQIMINATEERRLELAQQVNIALNMSKYPPAFGMIGTIIGLVAVLQSMGNIDNMEKLGPMMAVALITTLYGLFIANFIIIPLANRLEETLNKDLKHRRIIVEGILLLNRREDHILTKEMLKTFLKPQSKNKFDTKNPNLKMAA